MEGNPTRAIRLSVDPPENGSTLILDPDTDEEISITSGGNALAQPLAAPERESYIFLGWAEDPDGEVSGDYTVKAGLSNALRVYAVWKIKPSVTFENGVPEKLDILPVTIEFEEGEPVTSPENTVGTGSLHSHLPEVISFISFMSPSASAVISRAETF